MSTQVLSDAWSMESINLGDSWNLHPSTSAKAHRGFKDDADCDCEASEGAKFGTYYCILEQGASGSSARLCRLSLALLVLRLCDERSGLRDSLLCALCLV